MPMNYLDLTGPKTKPGSLYDFVNYKKVPVAVVIEQAEAFIYSQLRVREMKASAIVSLAVGDSSSSLPTGFLETIALRDRTNGIDFHPDRFVDEPALLRQRNYTNDVLDSSTPMNYAIFDEAFQFDCKAEDATKYDLVYYKTPTALSASNKTNFLTSRYPHILRVGCLAGAAQYMKDTEELAGNLSQLTALCQQANAESDLGRAS